jgi:signal transduction histidine kinase/ligand-binding sensor domain-containing protein
MNRSVPFRQILPLVIVLSLTIQWNLNAQFPKLNFKSFTEKDGLSKDYVRSICQDKDGFMWFGTPDGIDKFDGKNFIDYNNLLKDSLSSNYQISYDIVEDNKGLFWISTYSNGIILFDKNRETVTRIKHISNDPSSLSNDNVLDVFEDKNSNIWVATAGGGLDFLQKGSKKFTHYNHDTSDPKSIGSDFISSVTADSKGNILALSIDGIISRFNPETATFENIDLPLSSHDPTIRRGYTPVIYVDSDDNIFAGGYYGLFILYSKSGIIKHIDSLNPNFNVTFSVTSILEIQKGIVALATSVQGLYLLDIRTGDYISYSNNKYSDYFLINNSYTSLIRSKDGLIWLGSFNAGVLMYNRQFSQFQVLSDLAKQSGSLFTGTRGASFCTSPDNKIWIASGDKKILAYDPREKKVEQVLKNVKHSAVNCLFSNNKGEIFIGTTQDGLIIYDFWKNITKVVAPSPGDNNSIASKYVNCVLEDSDSKVFIGFLGKGLDIWDKQNNKITHFKSEKNNPNSLNSDVIYRMIEDRTGRVWIGTQKGLCYYNREKQNFTRCPLYINEKYGLELNTILDIFEDSYHNIWVGTDRAIFKLNPENHSTVMYKPKQEEPYIIANFMEDSEHNLWMTSFNKLLRLKPNSTEFTAYNLYNGNSTPSFLGYGSLSAFGWFYLGSLDRIIIFNPAEIVEDTLKPKIFVTDFEINNTPVRSESSKILTQHINHTRSIKLDYSQATFSFVFASIEYSFPEEIRYAYILDNFDNGWVYPGILNNRASYTRVPPGKYTFRVKATNTRGEWFESDQKIKITITPPFWKTLLFRIIAVILLLSAILFLYSLRVKKLTRQKKRLEQAVKQRTIALKEANVSLAKQHEELINQNELLSDMSQQILKQNKELEMHYSELGRLVDERTRELNDAKNRAEESDRLKSAFLANMSHEIRTPMNAIVGFANLLKENDYTIEDRKKYIEVINSSSDSLLILIDDILNLSMIEANQVILRDEIIDVNEMMDQLYTSHLLLNKNEELTLILNNELNGVNLKIMADKVRIKQIFTNLLSNAMKFTEGGKVELGLRMNGNNLAFYVKDTGIGIPEKDFEIIFERFRKSEVQKATLYRGAGLGLSISRALANLMGGKITVESEVGKGSIFTLLLPDSMIIR